MRMLACLSSRDAGDLSVLGMDPDRDARVLKARLGVVPQGIEGIVPGYLYRYRKAGQFTAPKGMPE